MHIFQADFLDKPPDRGLCHLSYIIVKQVIVNQERRRIDDIFRVAETGEYGFGHAGADMIMIVESRAVAIAVLRAWLADIVEEGGETDVKLR